MSQAAIRKASMKKGKLWTCLAWRILSARLRLLSQMKPRMFQQYTTNGHVKKRWYMVSSAPISQSKRSSSSCTYMYLLVSIVFVLRQSTATSQAKNLILAVQLDFQIKPKTGWAWVALRRVYRIYLRHNLLPTLWAKCPSHFHHMECLGSQVVTALTPPYTTGEVDICTSTLVPVNQEPALTCLNRTRRAR